MNALSPQPRPCPRAGAEAALSAVAKRLTEMATRQLALSKATGHVNDMLERGNLEGALQAANRLDALAESLNDAALPRTLQGETCVLRAYLGRMVRGA